MINVFNKNTRIFLAIFGVVIATSAYAQVGIGTQSPKAGLHVEDTLGVLFSSATNTNFQPAPVEGAGRRMMWYPFKAAFRVGTVSGNQWDTDSIGFSSFAGSNAKATNSYTFAFGEQSAANGSQSLAFGTQARAVGLGSMAIGFRSYASGTDAVAMGETSTALGRYSIAIGSLVTTAAEYSTSIGARLISSGTGSVALGFENEATGNYATVMGRSGRATGQYSFVAGGSDTASGSYAIAMGLQSNASNVYSIALGYRAKAGGGSSFAVGNTVSASGMYSVSIGRNNQSSSESATAIGANNSAIGTFSTAIGNNSRAAGSNSFALGNNVTASGNNSVAIGSNVTAGGVGTIAIGDNSTNLKMISLSPNRMAMRFAGGYFLYTNSTLTMGVQLNSGGNSWATISDSTKKENFLQADGTSILSKISNMRLGSWNYKGQNKNEFRHYGPMAQEFYKYFGHDGIGTIGNDTTIASADIDGVMMIAIQALIAENDSLKQHLAAQEKALAELTNQNKTLLARFNELAAMIERKSKKKNH